MPAYKDARDGTWRYRKWVVTPSGKRTRITGTPATDTKSAAEAAERRHIERVMNPNAVLAPASDAAPSRKGMPTVKEFEVRFMAEYLPRQKPSSRQAKVDILREAIVPFFGAMRLDEIDQSHINAFVATCGKLAAKTVNNKLTVLSTLLRYAGPKGCQLIPEVTLSCHVKGMSAEVHAVPAADVAKLITATSDARYRAAILLAAESGLRVGEIRALQWTDIKDGRLTVRRSVDQRNHVGPPKHDKRRAVRLSPAVAAALDALPRRGLWVVTTLDEGEMLGYWGMLEVLNATYVRAGVPVPASDAGITRPWHSLRHTFGTECAARGVPVPTIKELMGHTDIATTMRYVSVSGGQMDAAIDRAFGTAGRTARQPAGNESTESA